jgi:mono/diheme cytochrome c family protein
LKALHVLVVAFSAAFLGACRRDMQDQPRFRPFRPTTFFADGRSARPQVAGTVARGELDEDDLLHRGVVDGKPAEVFPFPVTAAVLERGRGRFDIFCAPCHGRLGDGKGMVPSRGYRHPPTFHSDALRNQPTGHFFDVMTNGFGAMPQYGTIIPPRDRWAIIAYIRALQLSQNATAADVPADAKLESGGQAILPVPANGQAGSPVLHGGAQ